MIRGTKRVFMPDEDQIILDQANGKINLSITRMEKLLSTNQETIFKRAEELGITLTFKTTREEYAISNMDDTCRINDDKLLKKLLEVHGNRRY